ncbi:T9SS type A sorting domain-containing protein [Bacteroidota bacterium]
MCKKLIASVNFTLSAILASNQSMAGFFKSSIALYSKRRMLIVLLVMILSSFAFPQWTRTNGPEGVAISSLASIYGTIYAGTEVNGVYASTDDGINWTARNTGIETLEVTSIVNKPGYIFAGTFGAGVYRSTDGGQTWMAPSNGTDFAVESIVIDNEYIFAATISEGVQRSSDNGATWEPKLTGLFGFGAICKSGNKVIASSSNYTLESTDHGETWSYITSLDGAIIFTYYCEGSTIIAGGQNKLYRSTDNGNTFTTIDLIFPFGIVNIYSITAIGSTLFAATSYDGVYSSTDNGSTWFSANEGMGPKDARAITTTNSSTLIAGSHYVGIYRSTDMGVSWNKSVSGFPAGISILTLLGSETGIYAGSRDGVYRTEDNGDSWIKLAGTNDTINYSSVWALCEKDGDIYVSTFLKFNTTVYKTTDKGLTWTRSGAGLPPDLSFMKGLVVSGDNIVAATDKGIYFSSDAGASWHQTNVLNQNIPSIAVSGNFVYAASPSGFGVLRSSDNGVNWIVVLQSTEDYVEVAAMDNHGFAGAFFGGARYSSNNGNTWNASNGFPFETSVFALGPVAEGMILAGTDQAPTWIYSSVNYGAFYEPYSEGLAQLASVEVFAVNDTFMFAGTDYHSVWRRLRPGIVSVKTEQEIPQRFYLAQNYPNPFNPTTTIQYSIPESGTLKLTVYNALGKAVRTLVKNYKEAGTYTINFNASDLSSGIYYYRIDAGEFTAAKKMILIK